MKIGDRVSVIDDNLEGIVVKISNNLVTFEDDNGFEYDYPTKKLVVINNALNLDLFGQKITLDKKGKSIKKSSSTVKIPVYDLHIEKLQHKHLHLSSGQKLEIQLKEAQRILQKFQRQHYRELVLIHGEGKGVLRQEIEKILRQKGFQFTDASYQKYGNGGILVLKN